jgi:hypothetical protein
MATTLPQSLERREQRSNALRYGHDGHTTQPSGEWKRNGHHTHTFDAAAWFAAWSDNGGIVMLNGDRLWIGRGPAVGAEAARALEKLRGRLLGTPDAHAALAALLRAKAGGMR